MLTVAQQLGLGNTGLTRVNRGENQRANNATSAGKRGSLDLLDLDQMSRTSPRRAAVSIQDESFTSSGQFGYSEARGGWPACDD